ncbi:MAG: sugar-binding protein [Candidatus Methylacidiphilales bacterium]|nr:sugar-binding protein [Candidatus Methylacidiphilales bacterium]
MVCRADVTGLSLSDKGVDIDAGGAGKFTLGVPNLNLGKKGDFTGEKPVVEVKDEVLTAKYPSGAEVTLKVDKKRVNGSFSNLPAEAKGFIFTTMVPISYASGGQFALGKKALKPFPEAKDKQFLDQGWAETFTLVDPSGAGFTMKLIPGSFQQLQDNRLWNWNIFGHIVHMGLDNLQGKTEFAFEFGPMEEAGASASPAPAARKTAATPARAKTPSANLRVDRYGQSTRKDYPGKVTTDEELKADGEKERAELAMAKPNAALDRFGGLAGSGEKYKLRATGFFRLDKVNDRHVMVTPDGNVYFQLAICGIASTDDFTTVKGRENIYAWLPDKSDTEFTSAWRESKPDWGIFSFYIANWIRKNGKPFTMEDWTAQAVQRMRSWGFNSIGAFSSNTEAMKSANIPTVSFLPLGPGNGVQHLPDKIGAASVLDPFYPGTEEALDKRFAGGVASRSKDPLLIGYFLGNEQHFELLPKLIPSYKASKVAAKARLVDVLKEKYKDIAAFNKAWNPAKPFASFDDLKEEPLFVRTDAGAADMKAFYEQYLEAYFSMVERVFRKHDPNHLIIGSRLTPGTTNNELAVKISGKYTDVVSINYYTFEIEKGFLTRAYEWSGKKPMIFSEWYYSTRDHGLNGGNNVEDQEVRGKAYRNYIEQSAALPFVVGSQWFIYTDQSITGRFFEGFHGEGANTGFVDVTDRPYAQLVAAAKTSNERIYDVMLGKEKAFAFNDPRFTGQAGGRTTRTVTIPRSLPGLKMDGTTTNWPGRPAEPLDSTRVVIGTPNPALRGDFRLCWDEKNLYFLIQVKDPTPMKSDKSPAVLWGADCVELFIGTDLTSQGNMVFNDRQILLGGTDPSKHHVVDHAEESDQIQSYSVKDVTADGYVVQAAVPWKLLGIEPRPGLELVFDVLIDNSDDGEYRKEQLAWNGTAKNSKDRGGWGRAKLVEN